METKQYNSLFSFIWNIANDVLVHAFEKGDYKKIILPFMVLRRIDVLLEPTKEKVLAKKEFCDKNGIVERILIVADKFQTGYDQPLLHTMYVDKMLSGLKAVQTLSRLNRCHPKKQDTFVLDFANDPELIKMAFQEYYKTTILLGESDVNKLNDLTETIEGYNFYVQDDIEQVVDLKLSGTDEDRPNISCLLALLKA